MPPTRQAAIEGLDDQSVLERIDRTFELVEGFESAYGLELLATIHWCAKHNDDVGSAVDAAKSVPAWRKRKERMFTDEHVEVAWDHLRHLGWIGAREPKPA